MLDDRQTAVLDLEDLPPEKARRFNGYERNSALLTVINSVNDNPVWFRHRLQCHTRMTGLTADFQSRTLSQASGSFGLFPGRIK